MENCSTCKSWLTQRVTDYADGSRIVNHQSPENLGLCEILKIETSADFGCNKHVEGHEHVEIMGKKSGSPWHHSVWGPCPDCGGAAVIGGGGCRRCAQTGRVLYYDDGFIGEEQTRLHPMEKHKGAAPKPKCMGCQNDISMDWFACPFCGTRIEKPAEPVRVSEIL